MKTRTGLSSLISGSRKDFALRTDVGSNTPRWSSTSRRRRNQRQLRLRLRATVIRIAGSLSHPNCYTAL